MTRRLANALRLLKFLTWRQAALGLALLIVLPNLPLLVGIDAPIWDASSFFAPNWMLVADHAREGRLLLWNPFVEGGSPDGAQPEYGTFSPLTIGLGALFGGTLTGFVVYTVTLWLLAGLGMLRLAKHLGAQPWVGLVVACGWSFSGTFIGHFQHTSWLCAYAFIPWVVWRVDVALLEGRFLPALQGGALLGLAGLSGYPTIVIQTGVMVVLWAAGRAITDECPVVALRVRFARAARYAVTIGLVAVVAIVVVAPSWIAFLVESQGYTWRSEGLSRATVIHQDALSPGALATFASPYLHVVAALWAPRTWLPTDGSSLGCYAGVAVGALALFALASRRRMPWLWWVVGMALFYLASSTDLLPLRGLLYDLFPWERVARHGAQRKDFSLFLLAVIAIHAFVPGRGERLAAATRAAGQLFRRCVVAIATAATICAGVAWSMLGSAGPRPALGLTHFLFAWGGLLVAGVLWSDSRRAVRRIAPGILMFVALIDWAGTIRLSRVLMVDRSSAREVWDRIAHEQIASLDLTKRGLARELAPPGWTCPTPNNQSVPLRRPVFESYTALTNQFCDRMRREPLLLRSALGVERVFFAPSAEIAPPDEAAWRRLVEESHRAGSAVLVVHEPFSMKSGARRHSVFGSDASSRSGAAERAAVLRPVVTRVIKYFTDEAELAVLVPANGWLLFTDRWARGWSATLDGVAVPVWGGNFLFRAIRVRGGAHTVHFVYRPAGYPWLLFLSWGALSALGIAAVRDAFRVRSSEPTRR